MTAKKEAEKPAEPTFLMRVTAPVAHLGQYSAYEGEQIEVNAQERNRLLFWKLAVDA